MIYRRSLLGVSLGRRAHRRWLVAGWWLVAALLYVLVAFILSVHAGWEKSVLFEYIIFFAFLAISSVGSLVWVPRPNPEKFSEGIRTLFDAALRAEMKKNPAPDEREKHQWEKSVRVAYEFLILGVFVFLAIQCFGWMPRSRISLDLLFGFAFFVVLQLPTAIYLWNEPDMGEAQP